ISGDGTLADTFTGNLNTGGPGAVAGQHIGQALFLAGSATYTVSAGTRTISDTIGGGTDPLITGGFTKSGAGTLTLSGVNSYTGTTTVSQGTLKLTGSGSFAASTTISAAAGATLDVSTVTGGANSSGGSFALIS